MRPDRYVLAALIIDVLPGSNYGDNKGFYIRTL